MAKKATKPLVFGDVPPGPVTTYVEPPANLDEVSRDVWKNTVTYLVDRELLHSGDLMGLAAFCGAYSNLVRMQSIMQTQSMLGEDGKVHPLLNAIGKEQAVLRSWALALHLAPYSRIGLAAKTRTAEAVKTDTAHSQWDGLIEMPKKRGRK